MLALVDTELTQADDFAELIGATRRAAPRAGIVLLAPAADPRLAHLSLELEVEGVVLKSAAWSDAVAALERIVARDAVFPAGWLAAAHRGSHAPQRDTLSDRQREVLELLAEGLPNETIAQRLFISRNTVTFHVAGIYERLGVRNRVEAAQALQRHRLAG